MTMGYCTPDDKPSGLYTLVPLPREMVLLLAKSRREDIDAERVVQAALKACKRLMAYE